MASYLKASIERSYAESFLAELERNENQYFLFVGKGTTWANENSPDTYTDSVSSEYQAMNDAIGYKKLSPENIIFALPRYEWIAGTTYDKYDDNINLFDENDPAIFYVVTDENNLYKCLENGSGVPSTEKPSQVLTTPFSTSDGYTWKYLATVKESNLPYELTDYIPVDFATSSTDTETQNQYNTQVEAVNGSITRMVVTNSSGASAGNYPYSVVRTSEMNTPEFVLNISTVEAVNSTTKRIRINESLSKDRIGTTPSNYIGYTFKVDNSKLFPSEINNYGVITDAGLTGSNNDVYLEIKNDVIEFAVTPTGNGNIASGEIVPYVKIIGNGSGAYAFPVMQQNANGGYNISSVNVVSGGRNYTKVQATVTSTKTATTNHPTIRTVLSPKGGHGSNILKELNVKDILIIVNITDDDAQKIVPGGSYRQFGIIKNPLLGDGSGVLAGREQLNFRDITLIPTVQSYNSSHFGLGEANIVIGTESYSAAKVVDVKSVSQAFNPNQPNDPIFTSIVLKTLNSSGKFITKQDRQSDYKIVLSTSTAENFLEGETVTQILPQGTQVGSVVYGFTLTVTGKVLSRSGADLVVRITSGGNFVTGFPVVGSQTGASAIVSTLEPMYGEFVWITNSSPAGLASFLTVNTSNQKIYKVSEIGQAYFDSDNTPSYSGLHVLTLTTSASGVSGSTDTTSSTLTTNSYSNGDVVHQGVTGQFGHYASGTVYKWDFINGSRGRLYLTDVLGTFKNLADDGFTGSQLGEYVVAGVSLPEIDRGSGEVLYIDNVRPIQRTSAQEEEFRLRLGF